MINLTKDESVGQDLYNIHFKNNPDIDELTTCVLVLEEILEHNFNKAQILRSRSKMFHSLVDIEEVRR